MKNAVLIIGILFIGTVLFGCVTISDQSQNNTTQVRASSNCPNHTGDTMTMKYDGTIYWIRSFDVSFSDGWKMREVGSNGNIASIPCHWGWSSGMENPDYLYCAAGLLSMSASRDKVVSQNGIVTSTSEGIGIGFVLSADENIDRNKFDTTTFHIIEMGCTDPIEQ